jgi:hypothetical protein
MKPDNDDQKKSGLPVLTGKVLIVLTGSAVIIYLIKNASHIHSPYLAAVLSAMVIGFRESKKGWILATAQCGLIVLGYSLLHDKGTQERARQEWEIFALIGSLALTFAGSFLAGFMKRALSS